jgi:hypothetical protein
MEAKIPKSKATDGSKPVLSKSAEPKWRAYLPRDYPLYLKVNFYSMFQTYFLKFSVLPLPSLQIMVWQANMFLTSMHHPKVTELLLQLNA